MLSFSFFAAFNKRFVIEKLQTQIYNQFCFLGFSLQNQLQIYQMFWENPISVLDSLWMLLGNFSTEKRMNKLDL